MQDGLAFQRLTRILMPFLTFPLLERLQRINSDALLAGLFRLTLLIAARVRILQRRIPLRHSRNALGQSHQPRRWTVARAEGEPGLHGSKQRQGLCVWRAGG